MSTAETRFLGHEYVNTTGQPPYLTPCDACGKPMRDANHWCGCCSQDTGLREELEAELATKKADNERLRTALRQILDNPENLILNSQRDEGWAALATGATEA